MIRAYFEAFLLRAASWVLRERARARADLICSRDNNEIWNMAGRLEFIASRIESEHAAGGLNSH